VRELAALTVSVRPFQRLRAAATRRIPREYERRDRALDTARATGKHFASEVVRIWTFRDGKATRVRSYYDTHSYAVALTGA
jgi:ketosteroid isomerase-like protein